MPQPKQGTRVTLKSAADAYVDIFCSSNVTVTSGIPFRRIRGSTNTWPNKTVTTLVR
ncbi:hypothetical protein GQ43DRAFT_437883 [Delitschia confertaspora ATCC 74209]|uniref:Uncharacterized protein n=1 Tax=Delitschia confertaspora ATCC 74209 TaxID=1513339 RepID=A0A9P4JXS1_9PLEO|nr:hypothetical protein GQ43DRAFT_437883 [Delitschia confertaspora ATCC 74209]